MFVMPVVRPVRTTARLVSPSFSSLVDRLFDEPPAAAPVRGGRARLPAMDVSESDAAYTVAFDVPGASRDALKVSVEGRRVTLGRAVDAGKAPVDKPVDADGEAGTAAAAATAAPRVIYQERSTAAYERTVVLPAEVDHAASQAKFENGVLTLTLVKKVATGATQLAIA